MFRKINKIKNEISINDTKLLLKTERRGVLAMIGDENYPYAIPINYLYVEEDNKIYFHGSRVGHKADSIRKSEKVCFTVIGNQTIKDIEWAPYVKSAIVFGKCKLINNHDKSIDILNKFANKYYPNKELVDEEINNYGKAVQMYEIEIESLSGKEIQEK